jgi:hypothetical protein
LELKQPACMSPRQKRLRAKQAENMIVPASGKSERNRCSAAKAADQLVGLSHVINHPLDSDPSARTKREHEGTGVENGKPYNKAERPKGA